MATVFYFYECMMPLTVYFDVRYTVSGTGRPAQKKPHRQKNIRRLLAVVAVSYIKLLLPPLLLCCSTYNSLAAKILFSLKFKTIFFAART
jgi:hypothetical protein